MPLAKASGVKKLANNKKIMVVLRTEFNVNRLLTDVPKIIVEKAVVDRSQV